MKRVILTLTTCFLLFSFTSVVFGIEMGNKRKGKYLYRKVYKTCFNHDAVDSKKTILNPDSTHKLAGQKFLRQKILVFIRVLNT